MIFTQRRVAARARGLTQLFVFQFLSGRNSGGEVVAALLPRMSPPSAMTRRRPTSPWPRNDADPAKLGSQSLALTSTDASGAPGRIRLYWGLSGERGHGGATAGKRRAAPDRPTPTDRQRPRSRDTPAGAATPAEPQRHRAHPPEQRGGGDARKRGGGAFRGRGEMTRGEVPPTGTCGRVDNWGGAP